MRAKAAQELRDLVRMWDEATGTLTEEEIERASVARGRAAARLGQICGNEILDSKGSSEDQ